MLIVAAYRPRLQTAFGMPSLLLSRVPKEHARAKTGDPKPAAALIMQSYAKCHMVALNIFIVT